MRFFFFPRGIKKLRAGDHVSGSTNHGGWWDTALLVISGNFLAGGDQYFLLDNQTREYLRG